MSEANIIFLGAGEKVARRIDIPKFPGKEIIREEWFPSDLVPDCLDRVETFTSQHNTGDMDYYCVFFDGHDNGKPNSIVNWLLKVIPYGVLPTGNFVIAHIKWIDGEETYQPVNKTLKELKQLFKGN